MHEFACFASIIECGSDCNGKQKFGTREGLRHLVSSTTHTPMSRRHHTRAMSTSPSLSPFVEHEESNRIPPSPTEGGYLMAFIASTPRPNQAAEEGYMYFMEGLKTAGADFNLKTFNSRGGNQQVMVDSAKKGFRKSIDQLNQLSEGKLFCCSLTLNYLQK